MQRGPRRTSSLRAPLLALALVCSGLLTAVTLTSASAASCRPGVPAGERGSCTILVSIVGSASVREGKSKTLKVTIRPATHPAFDLLATTSSGTARAPGDYRALSGRRVRVDANASSASVTVRTVNGSALELPERFTVKLDRTDERLPGGYVVRVQQSAAKAAVTITDDDSSVVSIKNVTVAETGATGLVPLTMTNPAGRFCRLAATTTNDSAIAGRDYLALTGGIFDLVVARDNLGVSILDDDLIESPETSSSPCA